jgi:hypothetical protein
MVILWLLFRAIFPLHLPLFGPCLPHGMAPAADAFPGMMNINLLLLLLSACPADWGGMTDAQQAYNMVDYHRYMFLILD